MIAEDIALNINKAIVAHSTWKIRIRKAIQTQSSEFEVPFIRSVDNCEFGKWLDKDKAILKDHAAYDHVVSLHQTLHEETARLMQLALSGNGADAESALQQGSKFATISSKLTITLMTWKKSLG